MMTDKELLELAAQAAGYGELIFRNGADDDGYDDGVWKYTWRRDEQRKLVSWNPLTDDGDALRLAVKLGIDLDMYKNMICCKRSSDYEYGDDYEWCDEDFDADPYSATRRAIVRAAAEIGKEM